MKQKRAYRQQERASGVQETRDSVLKAAYELFLENHYDDVSLQAVAAAAGVSKQTVIRQFGSKDRLAVAVVDWQRPREEAARAVEPGDLAKAVSQLVERYEAMGDANVRVLELESRVPAVEYLLEQGRESHRAWVEKVFAPYLPPRPGAARRRRVMAFYAATEVMSWKLLRRDFQLSRVETKAVFLELVSGLAANGKGKERP